ncbi:GTP-binding protein [Chitinispirillum alkaliphilum]|nr:GTP-binding protein [Chitinispirillum alkaliphilum]
MPEAPVISIIGRPNVGKSSLFNRIVGKRIAVVDDLPGVTRDRNYIEAVWNGQNFILADTGGMVPNDHSAIPEAIHSQVEIAIKESAVVIFVVEAGTGVTDLDLLIAKQLRRNCPEKTMVAVNKAESSKVQYEINTYRSLGLGDPLAVSAIHGQGVADLLDNAVKLAQTTGTKETSKSTESILKVAITGRPNAGKSSLVNKLLNENRMIVDSVAGTTRDAVDSEMIYKDTPLVIIDTAGLRKKSHVKKDVEYYSNLRALDSIERCDICLLVIDVTQGIGIQDLRILKRIYEKRKGVLLVWNKWDIMEKDHRTFDTLVQESRSMYKELKYIPMISVSALSGKRVNSVLEEVLKIRERMSNRVPGSEFENLVFDWTRVHPHPVTPGKVVRFLGAKQAQATFPLFRFFVTFPQQIADSYVRYLANKIHETYDFRGCPVVLEFKPVSRSKQTENLQQ